MPFATPEELAAWMQHPAFDPARQERALLLLDAATGVIEAEAGQPLVSEETTEVLDGTGARLLILSRRPVTAVAQVVEDGTPLVLDEDYSWRQAGILTRLDRRWPARDRAVEVTYTAGLTVIPDDLRRVALELAARAWDNPLGASGEQIGDRNVQWRAVGMEPTGGQLRIIDRYRSWW